MTPPLPTATADRVLVAVAVPLVLAGLASLVLPVDAGPALAVGSVPAAAGVGYALFLDPPVEHEREPAATRRPADADPRESGDD